MPTPEVVSAWKYYHLFFGILSPLIVYRGYKEYTGSRQGGWEVSLVQ